MEESKEIEDSDARKKAFAEVLVELIEPHAPAINEKFKALGKWLEGGLKSGGTVYSNPRGHAL